jgi:Spx/MgsR family transcriptional regulator
MITLYGLKTCDTCRKARQWLATAGIDYAWIDVRADGITRERLEAWQDALGAAALLNKRSKTWRDFDASQREATAADPIPVLLQNPTLIKRPILETGHETLAGFSLARYETALTGTR